VTRTLVSLASTAVVLATAPLALATGFTDRGQDIVPTTETRLVLGGAFRLRSEALYNLDLDRGPTPSGELLFPVSVSDPKSQTLTYHDLRLRTDFAAYAPGGVVAVKARVDVLDNMPLGGSADGIPGGSTTQQPPTAAFRIKRAWGEVLTPVGYLAAGRMGHHWGLGMLGNGGDCADCDSGDAADRIAFATAAASHIFAVAYDFSASGHVVNRADQVRSVDIEPSAAVRTVSVAVLNWRDEPARRRRAKAGKATLEYGAMYARRWQNNDIPATYLPVVAGPDVIDAGQVVGRGLNANVFDFWSRFSLPGFRIEIEGAYSTASFEQASLIPGLEMRQKVEARQYGAAMESEVGEEHGLLGAGLDLGYASGDDAPGFGARPPLGSLTAPQPGDLDGPQGTPPYDFRVDNFRFHPDYRVDRILFREIIGTVTDAVYVRPHVRLRLLDFGTARLQASLAGIASFANYASSTPGGEKYLGFELNPTLAYTSDDGFGAAFEHAVLFPGAGLNNPDLGLTAKPAQLYRLRLSFGF
jgi:uncharacterized protein (TIGR04551 family)